MTICTISQHFQVRGRWYDKTSGYRLTNLLMALKPPRLFRHFRSSRDPTLFCMVLSPNPTLSHFQGSREMMMVPTCQPECFSSRKAITLGNDFRPGEYDVICGRGRRAARHVGNRRFRLVIQLYLDKYMRARTKSDKSLVVIEIVEIFRRANGTFVKPDTKHKGQWIQLGNQVVVSQRRLVSKTCPS
jgi:hypothetical protein